MTEPHTLRFERIDADRASPDDVAAIDRLLHADAAAFARPPREHLEGAIERLDEASVDHERVLVVARADGAVVGFADARVHHPEPDALTIAAVAVDKAARRHGHARHLVTALIAEAGAEGLDGDPLLVAGVHAENLGARAFFEALGFAPHDESARVVVLSRRGHP